MGRRIALLLCDRLGIFPPHPCDRGHAGGGDVVARILLALCAAGTAKIPLLGLLLVGGGNWAGGASWLPHIMLLLTVALILLFPLRKLVSVGFAPGKYAGQQGATQQFYFTARPAQKTSTVPMRAEAEKDRGLD